MSKIEPKTLAVIKEGDERNLVYVIHCFVRYEEYCSIRYLHFKFKGRTCIVPTDILTPFSFEKPGDTSDKLDEVFLALVRESDDLRKNNRILKQRSRGLETIVGENVDAIKVP